MQHPKETFLTNKTKRILFIFCAFIFNYLISYFIDPYSEMWHTYFDRGFIDLLSEWIITFMFCFLVAEAVLVIHKKLNKTIPWTSKPIKRLLSEISLNIGVVLILIFINMVLVHLIYFKDEDSTRSLSITEMRQIIQWLIVSLVIAFIIMGVNTGSFMINNWKSSELEVTEQKLRISELRQASVEAELHSLRLQLDPHFIFNNLSVLSELILEDPKIGYEYSENFAKVYRFILLNAKRNLIPLAEELKFVEAYIFLIQQRVGSGVAFNIDLGGETTRFLIPPLTVQLLIENALKHNVISKKNPLKINISVVDQGRLLIENMVIPLEQEVRDSTGIGLANIIRRYTLLGHQPPQVITENGFFKIYIYLIANYE